MIAIIGAMDEEIRLLLDKATINKVNQHAVYTFYEGDLHGKDVVIVKCGVGKAASAALVSALSGKKVRSDVAMTGEVTLTGKVLPIGGLKEKSLAAYRAGIKTIIIPNDNNKDIEDIPGSIRSKIKIIKAKEVKTVIENAIIGDDTSENKK